MTPAPSPLPAGLRPAIASVITGDLVQRLGVSQRDIALVSAESMQAPPRSFGCGESTGEEGEAITVTEVRARVQGETYVYRTDGRKLIPCSDNFGGNRSPIYLSGEPVAPSGRPQDSAVADLARRLSIPEGEIKVVSVEAVEWPDASVGCPQPGMMYAQVITPGHLVILEANGRTYRYHGGRGNVFLCERRGK